MLPTRAVTCYSSSASTDWDFLQPFHSTRDGEMMSHQTSQTLRHAPVLCGAGHHVRPLRPDLVSPKARPFDPWDCRTAEKRPGVVLGGVCLGRQSYGSPMGRVWFSFFLPYLFPSFQGLPKRRPSPPTARSLPQPPDCRGRPGAGLGWCMERGVRTGGSPRLGLHESQPIRVQMIKHRVPLDWHEHGSLGCECERNMRNRSLDGSVYHSFETPGSWTSCDVCSLGIWCHLQQTLK